MISYLGHSGKIVARANQLQSQGLFKLSWEPVGLNFPLLESDSKKRKV